MTIWIAKDRTGTKYFSRKPEFRAGFDIFVGLKCRAPGKGDRCIRKFVCKVVGTQPIEYPDKFKVGY